MKCIVMLALLCLPALAGPAEAAVRKPKTEKANPLLKPNNDAMLRNLKNDRMPQVRDPRERRAPGRKRR